MSKDIFVHCQSCPVFTRIWEGVDILDTIEKNHRFIQRHGDMQDNITLQESKSRREYTMP